MQLAYDLSNCKRRCIVISIVATLQTFANILKNHYYCIIVQQTGSVNFKLQTYKGYCTWWLFSFQHFLVFLMDLVAAQIRKLDFLLHETDDHFEWWYDLCEFVMFHAYKIFRCEKDCKLEVRQVNSYYYNAQSTWLFVALLAISYEIQILAQTIQE